MENKDINKAFEAYYIKFGKSYPIYIGVDNGTEEEIIARIDSAIRTGIPVCVDEPKYKDGVEY